MTENDSLYLAYAENFLVGYAYLTASNYLRDVFVKAEYQNKGVGSLLLERIISDVRDNTSIFLETYPNQVDFYRKYDFTVVSENESHIKVKRYKKNT